MEGIVQGADSLDEILIAPCACLKIDILIGSCLYEGIVVDGHAGDVHGDGIEVAGTVRGKAGRFAGIQHLSAVVVVPQGGQIHHTAHAAPILHRTLGRGEDDVGGLAALDSGGNGLVGVLLREIFHVDADIGMGELELHQHGVDLLGIVKITVRIRPEGQFRDGLLRHFRLFFAAGGAQHHHQCQHKGKQSFHRLSSVIVLQNRLILS